MQNYIRHHNAVDTYQAVTRKISNVVLLNITVSKRKQKVLPVFVSTAVVILSPSRVMQLLMK